MTFRQILIILRAHRDLALRVFLGVVAASMLVSLFFPRQYTASATVVVDIKTDPLSTSLFAEESNVSYLGTQVEIAGSERVAQRVVKTLQIDAIPKYWEKWRSATDGRGNYEAWLAHWLLKRVTITPVPLSNVIEISVKWPDAKFAADLANGFAQAYIDTNVSLKVQMAKEYSARFQERAQALRDDLIAKQRALSDFENKSGIVITDEKLDVENARLNELSSQLVAIQGQREDSHSREQQTGREGNSMPEVLQNPLVTSLKSDLSKADARQKDLETSLGVNHPAYQAAKAEADSLRDRLAQEVAAIVASFGSSTHVNERREGAIREALEAQRHRILDLQHQRDEAAVLQNDVATAQRNLDGVSQRLAQSTLESSTDRTNIGLLTAAAEPAAYSSPKYWLILAIAVAAGAFLGLAAAMLRELWDPRVRNVETLEDLLGAPVFGIIAAVTYPARKNPDVAEATEPAQSDPSPPESEPELPPLEASVT
jgi:chain length determinant protein EpsF